MGTLIEPDNNVQEVINISSENVKMQIGDMRVTMKPGDRLQVHRNYAFPRQLREGRDPIPSVVELESGGKVVPTTDPRARSMLRQEGLPIPGAPE